MPEDQKNNPMKSLEDQGWEDMKIRLNKNLPVQKGFTARERLLLFLLLLTLVSASGYIVYHEVMDVRGPALDDQDTVKDSGGEFAQVVPGAGTSLGEPTGIGDAEREPVQNPIERTGKSVTMASTRFRQDASNPLSHGGSGLYRDSRNKMEIGLLPYSVTGLAGTEGKEILPDAKHSLYKGLPVKPFESRVFSLYPDYYRVPVVAGGNELALAGDGLFVQRLPIECNKILSVSAGMISENLQSFGGLEASLDYYRSFSDRWVFQTGLAFQVYSKDGFANSPALSAFESLEQAGSGNESSRETWVEERYQYEVQNSEIVNDRIGAEYITGIVDNLYYLTVPANMMFQFHHTSLFGGISASWLLYGTNQVHDYNDQYFNTVVLSNTVLQKRNYLNRLDLGVQVGMETRLWKNWYVYAKYNYGLYEIIDADSAKWRNASFRDNFEELYPGNAVQRVDFNRYFSFGVKYVFNHCDGQ
jgi:hypothetical protein